MKLSPNYELIDISGECIAVPVGEMAKQSRDVFTFSRAGTFIVKNLQKKTSENELIEMLITKYSLEESKAKNDLNKFISDLKDCGLIVE